MQRSEFCLKVHTQQSDQLPLCHPCSLPNLCHVFLVTIWQLCSWHPDKRSNKTNAILRWCIGTAAMVTAARCGGREAQVSCVGFHLFLVICCLSMAVCRCSCTIFPKQIWCFLLFDLLLSDEFSLAHYIRSSLSHQCNIIIWKSQLWRVQTFSCCRLKALNCLDHPILGYFILFVLPCL